MSSICNHDNETEPVVTASRAAARCVRQVVEIATLVATEHRKRAPGLATMHIAEFPDDADLLAQITRPAPLTE